MIQTNSSIHCVFTGKKPPTSNTVTTSMDGEQQQQQKLCLNVFDHF